MYPWGVFPLIAKVVANNYYIFAIIKNTHN